MRKCVRIPWHPRCSPVTTMRVRNLPLQLTCALVSTAVFFSSAAAQDEEPKPDAGTRPPPSGGSTGTPPDHHLAESETAYTGAVMLTAGTDIVMGEVLPGSIGDIDGVSRNARFIGNTLYAEATDEDGNAVAMVSEFYWFESSVPRGSDFFVGVVKARTIPHLAQEWVLEHDPNDPTDVVRADRGPCLYVRSQTSPELEHGSFRWDWSLPFRDYHMDAYGTIRMRADYGVGLMSNGSAQTAYQRNEHGVEVEVEAQATGHINTDYNVNTNYEVTLYRWDVFTRNSGNMLEWSMFLRTGDREQQNAYHEFFIAMQVDEGGEFRLGNLEVGGSIKRKRDFWFDEHRALSVAVSDILLKRPAYTPSTERADAGTGSSRPWENVDGGTSGGFDWPDDDDFDGDDPPAAGGCTVVADRTSAPFAAFFLIGVGMWLVRRRSER